MRCEECGVTLPNDATRCPICGAVRAGERAARHEGSTAAGIPTRTYRRSSYGPPITADTDAPGSVVMERLTGPHRAVGYRPIIPPPPPEPVRGCVRPIAITILAFALLVILVLLMTQRGALGL
ncbi:MAG TPA: hypothetical protein VJN88_12705 [Ktedonobacterales bacterium]|nr:hypothetical protein [Ktedonobacterales bacterium]